MKKTLWIIPALCCFGTLLAFAAIRAENQILTIYAAPLQLRSCMN